MKKKLLVVSAVCIVATAIIAKPNYAKAAITRSMNSKGNVVLYDGSSMAIYSADIQFLQEELNDLFSELPNTYNKDDMED